VRKLLDRVQVLVSLFIEAGTPLETDDPEWTLERWTVYFVWVFLLLAGFITQANQ
jgi:histone acetyltransferase 1